MALRHVQTPGALLLLLLNSRSVLACPSCTVRHMRSELPQMDVWLPCLGLWALGAVLYLRVIERNSPNRNLLCLLSWYLVTAYALSLLFTGGPPVFLMAVPVALALLWLDRKQEGCPRVKRRAALAGAGGALGLVLMGAMLRYSSASLLVMPVALLLTGMYCIRSRGSGADWVARGGVLASVVLLPWLLDLHYLIAMLRFRSPGGTEAPDQLAFIDRLWDFYQIGLHTLAWLPAFFVGALLLQALIRRRSVSALAATVSLAVAVGLYAAPVRSQPLLPGHIIDTLKAYAAAQDTYLKSNHSAANGLPPRQYAPSFVVLGGTGSAVHRNASGQLLHLLPKIVAEAVVGGAGYGGYCFADLTVDDPATQFGLCAVPTTFGETGTLTAIINQDGLIHTRDTDGVPIGRWPTEEIAAGLWTVAE